MTGVKAAAGLAAAHWPGSYRQVDLMYYIILFAGVISFLAAAAWLDNSRRQLARAGSRGAWHGAQAAPAAAAAGIAELLKGERQEDKPCLTPIDCVSTRVCAGHCGSRR